MDYIIEDLKEIMLNDPAENYSNNITDALTYNIIGAAMEVYNTIGRGFLESVYKDCLCVEFNLRKINYSKEKKFEIIYKGVKIPRSYTADFIIEESVVLEIKSQNNVIEENIKQTINYLAVSKCKIGLLINFGENSLKYKTVILSK